MLVLEQWEEKGKRELSSSDIEQWPRAQRLLWLPALPHWENLSRIWVTISLKKTGKSHVFSQFQSFKSFTSLLFQENTFSSA